MEETKKESIKKLISWSGFKKEIPWILFIIGILIVGYSYNDLKKRHWELQDSECIWNCQVAEYVENVRKEYPTAVINCDYNTRNCLISGTKTPIFRLNISQSDIEDNG